MIFLTHILEINRELGLGEYPVQGQEKVVEMWKEREEHKKSGQQIGSTTAGKTVLHFCFPLFRPSFLCPFLTASRQRSGMSTQLPWAQAAMPALEGIQVPENGQGDGVRWLLVSGLLANWMWMVDSRDSKYLNISQVSGF